MSRVPSWHFEDRRRPIPRHTKEKKESETPSRGQSVHEHAVIDEVQKKLETFHLQ